MKKKYQFNNIFAFKFDLIFSFIPSLDIICYEFKNVWISEIVNQKSFNCNNKSTNILSDYTNKLCQFWLIIKLTILNIEYKVFRETSYANDSIAKPRRKIEFI